MPGLLRQRTARFCEAHSNFEGNLGLVDFGPARGRRSTQQMFIERQCATISEATDCLDTVRHHCLYLFLCFCVFHAFIVVSPCWFAGTIFFWCVCVCVPGTCVLAAEAEDITKMSSSHVRSDQRQGRSLRSASSTPPLRDEHSNDHSQIRVHADYGDMFETDLHHGRQDTHAVLPGPQPHTPGTDQSVQLSDLLQLMSQQEEQRRRDEAARQALEERRLRLEELKIQLERERMEKENAREASQAAATALDKATRLKERDLDRRLKEVPQLPRMSEEEDVEMYLAGFEKRMNSLEIPHDRWVANLHPLLSTWALGTVDTLNAAESRVYSKVKKTLLEAFESTQGSLGQRVLNPKRKPGQKAAHLAAQLQRSWTHWTEGLTVQEICAKCTMIQIEMMLPLP